MVINPLKAFLFLAGGVVAAGVTAYVSGALDPYLFPSPPAEVASLPEPAAPAEQKAETAPPAAQPGEAAAPAAVETAVVPSFDVVRVEPNGSVVIAGSAAPQSLVEVMQQDQPLASSKADVDGAFAIVFDNPLKPGDYQLSLRATGPNGVVAASTETAVISIPETPSGEVLAMVEEPGKPAEIITLPQPAAGETAPAAAGAQPAAEQPAGEAKPDEAEAAAQPAATEPAPAATTEEPKPAAPETVVAGSETAPAEAAQPAGESAAAPAAEPAAPPAAETQVAAAEPAPAEPAPAAPAAVAAPAVAVDAVEIEGKMIFVAGTAEAGRIVRIYANADMLGEAKAAPNGRFLVEAERELAVGEYLIRADVLGDDGMQVIARAVVPFDREPGESIAAVAPPAAEPAPKPVEMAAADTAGANAAAPAEQKPEPAAPAAGSEQAAAPAETAPATEAAAQPEPAAPAAGSEQAAAQPEPAPATEAAAQPEPAAPATGSEQAAAPAEPAPATEAAAQPEPAAPATGSEQAAAPAGTAPATEAAAQPEQPAATEPAPAAEPAAPEQPAVVAAAEPPAEAKIELPKLGTDIAGTPPEVTAPKLQAAQGAVIIRRGDSLWRISRRVYGRGIRYSTIYLANQDQISDPNRIWPGQVFSVPEKTPQGEAANMKAIGEQATTKTQ